MYVTTVSYWPLNYIDVGILLFACYSITVQIKLTGLNGIEIIVRVTIISICLRSQALGSPAF